jgi:hypothetical protein
MSEIATMSTLKPHEPQDCRVFGSTGMKEPRQNMRHQLSGPWIGCGRYSSVPTRCPTTQPNRVMQPASIAPALSYFERVNVGGFIP